MKLCIRAVYTPVLTGEKLHFVSAKNDNFRLALTASPVNLLAELIAVYGSLFQQPQHHQGTDGPLKIGRERVSGLFPHLRTTLACIEIIHGKIQIINI